MIRMSGSRQRELGRARVVLPSRLVPRCDRSSAAVPCTLHCSQCDRVHYYCIAVLCKHCFAPSLLP